MSEPTPLERSLKWLGLAIVWLAVTIILATLIAVIAWATHHG